MKTILLAAALALTATTASAGNIKLPEEFLGNWCVAAKTNKLIDLQRGGCTTSDEEIVIGQDSLYYSYRCKLIESHRSPPYGNGVSTFVMTYSCTTPEKTQKKWTAEMFMKRDILFLNYKRPLHD